MSSYISQLFNAFTASAEEHQVPRKKDVEEVRRTFELAMSINEEHVKELKTVIDALMSVSVESEVQQDLESDKWLTLWGLGVDYFRLHLDSNTDYIDTMIVSNVGGNSFLEALDDAEFKQCVTLMYEDYELLAAIAADIEDDQVKQYFGRNDVLRSLIEKSKADGYNNDDITHVLTLLDAE